MVEIRPLTSATRLARPSSAIYAEGIATAATRPSRPSRRRWERVRRRARFADHRFVAVEDGSSRRLGGALADVAARRATSGVVEHSVYVAESARGRGIGRALLEALLASADAGGIWTIQTSIFPENEASVALHERVGFRVVGRRERIAKLDGVWRDTVLLERRSRAPADRVRLISSRPSGGRRRSVVAAEAERVGDADLDLLRGAPRSGCSRGRTSGSGVS